MDTVKALDVSKWTGAVSTAQWAAALSRGYNLAVVGAWHGTQANDFAEATLKNARSAGLDVAAYCVLNSEDGSRSIHDAMQACGDQSEYLSFMALDIEVQGLNHQIFNDAANTLASVEVISCVYTRYSFWHDTLGNPEWGINLPLWTADYESGDSLVIERNYGLWTQENTIGRQYQGSNNRLGFNADLNIFKAGWWK